MPEEDKEDNDRAKFNGEPILGLYRVGKYDVAIILPKQRDKLEVVMRHELGKERIHNSVLYDSKGIRITK